MRTKFLLSLCLAAMPLALAGCDGGGDQVGTGMKEMPPDIKAREEENANRYKKMMEEQKANPTPIPEGSTATPPAGG